MFMSTLFPTRTRFRLLPVTLRCLPSLLGSARRLFRKDFLGTLSRGFNLLSPVEWVPGTLTRLLGLPLPVYVVKFDLLSLNVKTSLYLLVIQKSSQNTTSVSLRSLNDYFWSVYFKWAQRLKFDSSVPRSNLHKVIMVHLVLGWKTNQKIYQFGSREYSPPTTY